MSQLFYYYIIDSLSSIGQCMGNLIVIPIILIIACLAMLFIPMADECVIKEIYQNFLKNTLKWAIISLIGCVFISSFSPSKSIVEMSKYYLIGDFAVEKIFSLDEFKEMRGMFSDFLKQKRVELKVGDKKKVEVQKSVEKDGML